MSSTAPSARTIGIGIIGMGFMGRTHLASFAAAQAAGLPCRLVAVADRDEQRRSGQAAAAGNLVTTGAGGADALRGVRGYADHHELLADPSVHAVSICTPTDLHVPVALAALAAGKHVLIEKPVALTVEEVDRLAGAARASGRVCMPAMCMRFWPGWVWLKEAIVSGRYGAVHSAMFTRIGSRPTWATEFYHDPARSGGAMFDLHVHDVDYILHAFGRPRSVVATGDDFGVTAIYDYSGVAGAPARVTATGAWLSSPGFPFRMQYLVEFERAAADWDLMRTPQLRLISSGNVEGVPLPAGAGYEGEVFEFVRAIAERRAPVVGLADALDVTAIVQTERVSQASGGPRQELPWARGR